MSSIERCPLFRVSLQRGTTVLFMYSFSLLGCGTGNYVVAVSPYVGRVTGVDFNAGMLEQARKKVAGLSNVELHQGDATQLDLPDGFCDAVIINQV